MGLSGLLLLVLPSVSFFLSLLFQCVVLFKFFIPYVYANSAGLPLTVYNAGTVRCWIAPYPLGCSDSACTRGHHAIRFRLIAHIVPIWVTIIIITILMVMLTLSVRNEEKMAIAMRDTSVENASGSEKSNSINNDDLIVDNGHEDPNLNQTMLTVHRTQVDRIPQFKREGSVRLERTKRMFHQALLYVAVFYLTWTIPTVQGIMRKSGGLHIFSLSVLSCTLLPLQGFGNWLVYRHGPCFA